MKHIPALFGALAFAACAATSVAATSIANFVALRQSATVGSVIVTPLQVIEDSRCPANAHCRWAGRLVLRVRIEWGSRAEHRDMVGGGSVNIAGGTLILSGVGPEPGFADGPKSSEYRFSFTFVTGP